MKQTQLIILQEKLLSPGAVSQQTHLVSMFNLSLLYQHVRALSRTGEIADLSFSTLPPAVLVSISLFSVAQTGAHFRDRPLFKHSVRHSALGSVIVSQLISSPGDLALPACISQPSHCKCFGLTQNCAEKMWLTPADAIQTRAVGGFPNPECIRRDIVARVSAYSGCSLCIAICQASQIVLCSLMTGDDFCLGRLDMDKLPFNLRLFSSD